MNEKIKEYGYLQFPLCLMQGTYRDREDGLNRMLSYGIVSYALKLDYDIRDAAKQAIYYYSRKRDILQSYMVKTIDKLIESGEVLLEDNYPGFDSEGNFNPDEDLTINPILRAFEDDEKLREQAVLNYRLHLATSANHLDINIGSNTATIDRYDAALKIKNAFEQMHGPDALPHCKKGLIFQYRDNTDQDIDLFRGYIGIKSLIGRRNFISTTKPVIVSRMIGAKSKTVFEEAARDKSIQPTVEKYSKRYHMDKLLMTLVEHKYIMFLTEPHVSLIYVSKYMQPDELAALVKQSRSRYDMKRKMKAASETLKY